MSKVLNAFSEQLEQSTTTSQAELLLDQYLLAAGLPNYAFSYYAGPVTAVGQLCYSCVSTSMRAWHEYYLDQHYAEIDRTLQNNKETILPLLWHVEEQLVQAKSARERRLRQESLDFGIEKGLLIPIHGPSKEFAVLCLHQLKDQNCLENLDRQLEWQSLALIYYHHIKRLLRNNPRLNIRSKLTLREKQCLVLTAKNWRVEQIADELNITLRTVNYHIQNANKKLGAHNKYQAVQIISGSLTWES